MRTYIVLPLFAFLLLCSTGISFLGYRYLSLASEYLERNMIHISETQELLDLIDSRDGFSHADVLEAYRHLRTAQVQAEWCISNLNPIETKLFEVLGAGAALEICRQDLRTAEAVREGLEQFFAPNALTNTTESALFVADPSLRSNVAKMREESRSFRPHVSTIEEKLRRFVKLGTLLAGFTLGITFFVLARAFARSVQEQTRQTKQIAELAMVAENANDAIFVTDEHHCITWVNPAFERLTGYRSSEVLGRKPSSFLEGEDTDPETVERVRQTLFGERAAQEDILVYAKSGQPFWINTIFTPLRDASGVLSGFVAVSRDITKERESFDELKAEQKRTYFQATHDPLTGLPNRRYIDDVLADKVTNADKPRTIMRIDLDHFKNVNDTLGHAAGDHVLKVVARILTDVCRADDLAARVGGDEFVVLLGLHTSAETAGDLAERIGAEIRKETDFEGRTCRVGASFGVSSALDGLVSNEDLLKSADAALYIAKDAGRNVTVLYTPEIHQSVEEKRELSAEIEEGLERGEFEAFFQPQFDSVTEVLVGMEALARWQHPTRGTLTPDVFLPVAEQLRIVPEIDEQVFDYGLRCVARMNALDLFVPRIAFNVGVAQLTDTDIAAVVERHDIGLSRVSLEILESVLVEAQGARFIERIRHLRSLGLGIEVDDFGSGHASVIALQKLEPDLMKIDGELVRSIDQSDTARALIKSIIEMGKTLGIDILAEGVETEEQARILRKLGCDAFQGRYFAGAMPFDELCDFARASYDPKLKRVTTLSVVGS